MNKIILVAILVALVSAGSNNNDLEFTYRLWYL